ncbi:CsbD family protein [Pseudactinotalea suaedae]|uniref:CsbD family protein n=1 Tax=Pseudactinotalea suaedae TaxID=1524924 RepID=UPI0012E1AE31|nr:CsbD family protein [Pseudactinotalea suaedae]
MGLGDKISNAADEAAGKAKEKVGDVTDNADLEREGQTQQAGANVRQAGEDVKDGVNSAGQNLKKAGSSASANAKEAWDDTTDKK